MIKAIIFKRTTQTKNNTKKTALDFGVSNEYIFNNKKKTLLSHRCYPSWPTQNTKVTDNIFSNLLIQIEYIGLHYIISDLMKQQLCVMFQGVMEMIISQQYLKVENSFYLKSVFNPSCGLLS
ncbi:Hypothetical_protein [Hexamita inflata]|uniref:Hypothetical_protein n=1 Tax=Hexamita inflata TaxID=28002 RepID=A0ABP1J6T0_9EUKA